MGYNCEFYVNILWRTILCEHLLVAYYVEEQGTTSNFRQLVTVVLTVPQIQNTFCVPNIVNK